MESEENQKQVFLPSHRPWKSRKPRGIPTFPTAPTAAGISQTRSGNLIVVDRKECLTPDNARYSRHICMEERRGQTFPEGYKKLGEEIDDALDAFQDDYIVRKLSAGDLTSSILSACVAIIKKGEAVDWQSAKRELPLATSVAVVFKGSEIVGVGVIKRERRKYAASVSSKSGVKFPPETLELGYVAVDPGHQGRQLSSRIAILLASQYKDRLFATTYHDRMKRTLARIGFVKKGNEWKSKNEKDMLSFWEKE